MQKYSLLNRIIDVNLNRARESIRVIEDYTRFILNNEWLTTQLRDLRHQLADLFGQDKTKQLLRISNQLLLTARNVQEDIGRENPSKKGKTISEIIIANFKRLEESLRSLAEYLKLFSLRLCDEIEKIRFQAYELEQQLAVPLFPKNTFQNVRLYVLVGSETIQRPIIEVIQQVIQGGADAIQLREKKLSDNKLIKLIKKIRQITLKHRVLFIVNDRADLAYLGQADGVHLGKNDISIRQARQILGPDKIIGATTHNIKEALEAQKNGADYISVGPMFASPTKSSLLPRGFSYIKEVAKMISIPYVAIGGINQSNLPILVKAHKKLFNYPLKVAISSAIISSLNPKVATKQIKKILGC